jgi:hypothetical protein
MQNRLKRTGLGLLLGMLLLVTGCAVNPIGRVAAGDGPSAAFQKRVAEEAGVLVLRVEALEERYGLLRAAAHAYAFLDDPEQLDYLQKAALYVDRARMLAAHRLEILQLLPRVRPSHMVDYCTLQYRGLQTGLKASAYNRHFLGIYQPFVEDEQTSGEIGHAVAVILEVENSFRRLLALLEPFVRKPAPERL